MQNAFQLYLKTRNRMLCLCEKMIHVASLGHLYTYCYGFKSVVVGDISLLSIDEGGCEDGIRADNSQKI